jgi:hypothetical protein
MAYSLKIFFLSSTLFAAHFMSAQNDTVLFQRDSVIEVEKDCTTGFFRRAERIPAMGKTMIVNAAGKPATMTAFFTANHISGFSEQGLTDLDKDGKKELVVYNFTNGAHCCDEIYIFKNTAPGKYQQVAKLFAGNTCINDSNEFLYDFYEQFGYFFTCYACAYEDTADTGPIPIHHIVLQYRKGKMIVRNTDRELKSKINDNLAKLGEQPYEKLEDAVSQDNGLRKEFAMNLAVYYYSFGRNLVETQKLFNKYYKFPDSKIVWTAFVRQIQFMKKRNIF